MIERKVYSQWAFSSHEFEKRDINMSIYDELNKKYKISKYKIDNPDDYDVIIKFDQSGYASKTYEVIKNGPGLSTDELALICDSGNLCFGYNVKNNLIVIYID